MDQSFLEEEIKKKMGTKAFSFASAAKVNLFWLIFFNKLRMFAILNSQKKLQKSLFLVRKVFFLKLDWQVAKT